MKLPKIVKSLFGGLEGSYRGPAAGVSEHGNWFSIPFGDGFQRGLQMTKYDAKYVPAVYAAVMSFARAVSQCYAEHKRIDKDGKHVVVMNSPAAKVLASPNSYYTWPQFIFNAVATMLFDGEALILLSRDSNYKINAMHIMPRGSFMLHVDPESKEVFYAVGSNPLVATEIDFMAPARDVIHLRQHTPRHPLIGESPIAAAALAIGINASLSATQAQFFQNMNRPSGVLSTEQTLNKEQMVRLREAFDEQSKKWATGGMPILANGLKFQQLSVNSVDAQLIESQRMSIEDIARVFGVPLPIIGDLSHATLANTEQLISWWMSMSLGSLLENIERSFDRAFGFSGDNYVELDVSALLRTDFMGRINGLTKGVQGGLFTPNEAREREGLPPMEFGDVPYLQAQMQPLGYKPDTTAPAPAPQPVDPSATSDNIPEEKQVDPTIMKALIFEMLHRKENNVH